MPRRRFPSRYSLIINGLTSELSTSIGPIEIFMDRIPTFPLRIYLQVDSIRAMDSDAAPNRKKTGQAKRNGPSIIRQFQ
jgi:hypothetical protein